MGHLWAPTKGRFSRRRGRFARCALRPHGFGDPTRTHAVRDQGRPRTYSSKVPDIIRRRRQLEMCRSISSEFGASQFFDEIVLLTPKRINPFSTRRPIIAFPLSLTNLGPSRMRLVHPKRGCFVACSHPNTRLRGKI